MSSAIPIKTKSPPALPFNNLILAKGPIKTQFYLALKAQLQSNPSLAGCKLPSSRSFALMMGISRNSVLYGLERLIDEGYLYTRHGAGTFVSLSLPDHMIELATPLSSNSESSLKSNIDKTVKPSAGQVKPNAVCELSSDPRLATLNSLWQKRPSSTAQHALFNVGIGCHDLFPHLLWGRLLSRTWRQFSHSLSATAALDNDILGDLNLRQAIADYANTTRGLNCHAEQIMIVRGTQQALQLTAQVLLQQGDQVCLDEPGYDNALGAFLAHGAQVHAIPSDRAGMQIDDIITHYPQSKLVFTAPSHQFPLGGTLSLTRRIALLNWAAQQQAWIFEDDYNSEFRYKAQPIQALQGLDQQQRVIYAGTFSKIMFAELRLGFLVIPPALLAAFKSIKHYTDARVAHLEQATLATFIREGHFARHVRRIRKACEQRQIALITALQRHLAHVFEIQSLDSGIHLLCYIKAPWSEAEIIQLCGEIGLGVQPLTRYCQLPPQRAAVLFGFAAHSVSDIHAGIEKLAHAIQQHIIYPSAASNHL